MWEITRKQFSWTRVHADSIDCVLFWYIVFTYLEILD